MNATTTNIILVLVLAVIAAGSIGFFTYARTAGNRCPDVSTSGFIENWKPCY